MCLEDVRLARKTSCVSKDSPTTAASAVAIPQNDKRYSLVISNTGGNPVYLSFQSPAVDAKGILLPVSGSPFILDLQHHGRILTAAIYAISPAGVSNVGWIETNLEET